MNKINKNKSIYFIFYYNLIQDLLTYENIIEKYSKKL